MTNPNDAIGTNAGFGGRTSPDAFNDILGAYTRGIVSGWECVPKSGMTVSIGGDASVRDVAIAKDNAGNATTINNRSGAPVDITIAGAPVTNNRIDLIVAYASNPVQGDATDVDFAPAVGIIDVQGTASATPTAPDENDIRTAITADGADGTTAYYVVLASIEVGQGVTTIGSGVISAGDSALKLAGNTVVKRTVLWEATGSASTGNTFALADDPVNYDELEVIHTLGGSLTFKGSSISRFQTFHGDISVISDGGASGTSWITCFSRFTVGASSMTRGATNFRKTFTASGVTTVTGSDDKVGIWKIVGIKYVQI